MTSNSIHKPSEYYSGSDIVRSTNEEIYQNHQQQIYGKETLRPRSKGLETIDNPIPNVESISNGTTPPIEDSPVSDGSSSQDSNPSGKSNETLVSSTFRELTEDNNDNNNNNSKNDSANSVSTPSTIDTNSSTPTSNVNGTYKKLEKTPEKKPTLSTDDITKIEDPEINSFLLELDQLISHLKEIGIDDQRGKELIDIITRTKSKLLRLNLNKNLIKFQLKNKEEDYQTEIQLLLKNISNFERSIQVLKNENEIINIKNLKLIKYCKSLKNDRIKLLKKENSHLKRQLEKYSVVLSPTIDTQSPQFQSQSPQSQYQQLQQQQQQAEILLQQSPESVRKRKRLSSSSSSSVSSNPEVYKGPISPNGPGNNMLDTLGRLASHVLEDGEFGQKKIN